VAVASLPPLLDDLAPNPSGGELIRPWHVGHLAAGQEPLDHVSLGGDRQRQLRGHTGAVATPCVLPPVGPPP